MHRYMHRFEAGWRVGVGGGRDRAVGSSKIQEPWPGVVDLNKEVAFVFECGKMIFRSTFGATYVCFKTLYSSIESENVILNENS